MSEAAGPSSPTAAAGAAAAAVTPPRARSLLVTIDALRGLAALGVLLFHAQGFFWRLPEHAIAAAGGAHGTAAAVAAHVLGTALGHGHVYVTLFFLISGFCIHLPYAGPTARLREAKPFLIRRLVRLWPAYFASVLVGFAIIVAKEGGWNRGLATTANLIGHAFFWLQADQPWTTRWLSVSPVIWSISAEIQLYLVYLLLWPILTRRSLPQITAAFLVVGVAYHVAYAASLSRGVTWPIVFYPSGFAVARLGEWLLGAWLAELYREQSLARRFGRFRKALLPLGAAGLVASEMLRRWLGWTEHRLDVTFSLSLACVVVWCLLRETADARPLARPWRWAAWLGDRSYSLYLIHFLILAIVGEFAFRALRLEATVPHKDDLGGTPLWLGVTFVGIVAAFVATEILYRLVERPSHLLAQRVGARRVAPPPVAAAAPVAAA